MTMGLARARVTGAVLAAAVLISGCGSGSHASAATQRRDIQTHAVAPTPGPRRTITLPTPKPTGIAASHTSIEVIRGWADALRRGNVRRAARYFALPSTMINGVTANGQVSVIRIRTFVQAALANATLPCGARFVKADQRGRFVNALFRLTGRPGPGGANCQPGAGQTARTNFVIRRGRIVEWIRAPDDPGDHRSAPRPAHPPRARRPSHPPPVPPTPGPTV